MIQGLKALFVQPAPAPTVDSVMGSFNKAIADLDDVRADSLAMVSHQQYLIDEALVKRQLAHVEADRASKIAQKLQAILS